MTIEELEIELLKEFAEKEIEFNTEEGNEWLHINCFNVYFRPDKYKDRFTMHYGNKLILSRLTGEMILQLIREGCL